MKQVDSEPRAIFQHGEPLWRRRTGQDARGRLQPLQLARAHLAAFHHPPRAGQLQQQVRQHPLAPVDRQRARLEHQELAIEVDGEPRQVVALGVDEAVGGRLFQARQAAPQRNGRRQPPPPKRLVDLLVGLPTEHPHLNLAASVEVARGQESPCIVRHCDDLAVDGLLVDPLDRAAEEPRVPLHHGLDPVRFQGDGRSLCWVLHRFSISQPCSLM